MSKNTLTKLVKLGKDFEKAYHGEGPNVCGVGSVFRQPYVQIYGLADLIELSPGVELTCISRDDKDMPWEYSFMFNGIKFLCVIETAPEPAVSA